MINIDVIILTLTDSPTIKEMTKQAIQSCFNSEMGGNIKFKFFVVESNKEAEPYQNCTMLYPDFPFNYNGYMNFAIKYCNGDYIAMCNNDLLFKQNWATILIKEMTKYGCLSGSPMSDQAILQRPYKNTQKPMLGYRVSLHISGWCLLAHKSVFDKIGKLNEFNTFFVSDTWYSKQIEAAGIKHIFVPYSKVYHLCSKTLNKSPKEIYEKYTTGDIDKFRAKFSDENKKLLPLPNPIEIKSESKKIVACFNAWDGEETLEQSVYNSIDCGCDVFIVFQNISNRGNKASDKMISLIEKLKKNKYIQSLIYFEPDLNKTPQENTVNKLNLGLQQAKKCGYDYIVFKDCDEFHESIKFKNSFDLIVKENYDSSYCEIRTYYFDEKNYFNEDYQVPFIYKISNKIISFNAELSIAKCDPCRKLNNPGKSILFKREDLEMHHFSYMRENLESKYKNANSFDAVKNNYQKIIKGIEYGKAIVFSDGGLKTKQIELKQLEKPLFFMSKKIDIIAVTYGQNWDLKCFISSILAQTNQNYRLIILHDGKAPESLVNELQPFLIHDKVEFIATKERLQHYGHPMRRWALQNIKLNEYILLTNGDNYYTPNMVDEILRCNEDFIYFNCVHSHVLKHVGNKTNYGVLNTQLKNSHIDMGCAVIRSSFAKKAGFNSDEFSGDWTYFEDVLKLKPTIKKIEKYLFVHN